MEYQILRGTGVKVSRVCLGTMTFGEQASEASSMRMIDRSLEAGVNFIDAADAYTGGRAEQIVGRALQGRRHRVVLASKVGNKHLRAVLYIPALVALQFQPNVKAFCQTLVREGKKKMQALVAVMRKLLRCLWGMFKQQGFDGNKFYQLTPKRA